MSKYCFSLSSIYIAGTNIPKNKAGIENTEDLHEIESLLLEEAYAKLSASLNTQIILDEAYSVYLHKKTFESLYDFAGVYRDVNMSKGESQFCLARYLHSESKRIFEELDKERYL